MQKETIKLTEYSHGSGCGCKIDPKVLAEILQNNQQSDDFNKLLVGNSSNDDAAVYQLNDSEALIATTDFFTPIVNDAFTFGKIAAANAISDVYAMGGEPILALAILGWPVETLPISLAQQVLKGARSVCEEVGIPLAGGHSIDTREPIFGLTVNGKVQTKYLKQNNAAKKGDLLLLTKPLGVGILAAAEKREGIEKEELEALYKNLTQLNKIGTELGRLPAVHAMTDVTGFGLAGHLIEMAEASELSAVLEYKKIPKLKSAEKYMAKNIVPDATFRNWNAYSDKIKFEPTADALEGFKLLPDPQTNGGLLIAVDPKELDKVQQVLKNQGLTDFVEPIGEFINKNEKTIFVQ